jgi:hypothetical protein
VRRTTRFRLRRIGLAHTQFAKAACGTIRLKLLKVGALVRTGVRRIKFVPYVDTQADGAAWEECAFSNAPQAKARQGLFPDGSRSFEEFDRLRIGEHGTGNLIAAKAEVDFYRVLPPSGYTKGLSKDHRTDAGSGDILPEHRDTDFFPYKPPHPASVPRNGLARATSAGREILASGKYDGAIWTEGSPRIEETIFWFNLLIDTAVPICGNGAQRPHGLIGNDASSPLVQSRRPMRGPAAAWQREDTTRRPAPAAIAARGGERLRDLEINDQLEFGRLLAAPR